MKINLFKRIKLYFTYYNIVKKITNEDLESINAKVDKIGRIYSVLNLPPSIFPEPFNINVNDIDYIISSEREKFFINIKKIILKYGLIEICDYFPEDSFKIDDRNYLYMFRYTLLDVKKIIENTILYSIILSILGLLFLLLHFIL